MRLTAIAAALPFGLAALMYSPPAQVAQSPSADVAIVAGSAQASGVGAIVRIRITLHNYGPQRVPTGEILFDLLAPGGTEWAEQFYAPACTTVVARRHYRCHSGTGYDVDGHSAGTDGGPNGISFAIALKVTARCTTPGRYRAEYSGDPKTSNNTATLRVTVAGVTAAECQPKPTTGPTPTASPTPLPSLSASAGPPSPAASETTPGTALAPDRSVRTAVATPLIVSGGGLIVVLAVAAFLVLSRRSRRTPASLDGPADPDDH